MRFVLPSGKIGGDTSKAPSYGTPADRNLLHLLSRSLIDGLRPPTAPPERPIRSRGSP
jgi:hypothetical protein